MTADHLTAAVQQQFDGDPVQAILEIARRHGVSVAYLDRQCFEDLVQEERGERRPLTDSEWETVRASIAREPADYDNWVDHTTGPTLAMVPREYMRYVLGRNFIEPPSKEEPWEDEADKEPRFRDGW